MRKQKIFKKLLVSIIMAIIVLGQFSAYRFTAKAGVVTSEGNELYLKLSRTNENGNGYGFGMDQVGGSGKVIWSIVSQDRDGSNVENSTNLYCIKAEHGTTWHATPETVVEYNKSYEIPISQNTESETANNVLNGKYKNEILWIIDQMYIPGESTDLIEYLKQAGIEYEKDDDGNITYTYYPTAEHDYTSIVGTDSFEETVLEEDIVAVQQAVLWYYTNYGENENVYNKLGLADWLQYTTNGTNYTELTDVNMARGQHATVLYNYLIDEAAKVAETMNDSETYKLKHSTAKLWLSLDDTGIDKNEQPVIEVHKLPEKIFDLSLRKAIVSVNGNKQINNASGEIATRPLNDDGSIQTVDTSALEQGTTADYNHRKDPIVVKKDDVITYAITIYNEGEASGYATQIVDQLPGTYSQGLRLDNNNQTVISSTGNIYKIDYTTTTNTITLTMTEDSPKNVLEGYNKEQGTLESETILLNCVVMGKADTKNSKVLTNIAYIAEEYNAYLQEIVTIDTLQDRDSQTWVSPEQVASNLVTTDIGYIGNKSNITDLSQNNAHYKGEQDDDDFEKVILLPESFDLSLRKYITKVDGNEAENTRTPDIDTTNLKDGTGETAEYKHRKDAVIVKDRSTVEYNISIYNEGSIDGIATIIKDQLPTGLKLKMEYFTKEGEEYFVTSKKGNIYKVSYDEIQNLVTFELDKQKTGELKYLQAFSTSQDLDEDIIILQCEVNCTSNDEQYTYLTNIAYIYEEEQEDGTVITNQETGSDSDRDSQPYTYPSKTADELKTIGDIGYKGNKENPTDLGQDDTYYKGEQDDDDFEKVVLEPKSFDLKLIKFITAVNDEQTENRILNVDTSKLNTTDTETTAEYILEKNPVSVKGGDFITYTIRIYNEGHYDGYATEISEDIPEGLEFIVVGDGAIWSWDGKELTDITEQIKTSKMYDKIIETNSNWGYDRESSIITTKALSEELIQAFGKENAEYADDINKIDYKEVSVIFRVKENIEPNLTVRNEAAISEDKAVDENGEELEVEDRDSVEGKTEETWKKENSDKSYDEEGKWAIYKEDDEDYDNIITKSFDLSLRKQIVQINDALYTQRFAKLDTEGTYDNTIYDYYDVYKNKPKVKAGDIITYSIRVYNEGEIDGYAKLISDTLPDGLEIVQYEKGDGSINDIYGWELVEGTENVYQTDYLSYEKDEKRGEEGSTILKAYTGQGEASYQEIYIECRVKEGITKEETLVNVAQITEDSDAEGEEIKDKDSIPGNTDGEEKWKEEDDLDIEVLEIQKFDLALRKYITEIERGENREEVTTREPEISYDEETGEIKYTHTKEAMIVHVGDTVIYTIRVYNEGDIDGYAEEIKDDIPEYLEYLPEHEINKENEWVMYNKDGEETEKVEEAEYIRTRHLAKGEGAEKGEEESTKNLIKAFDKDKGISEGNPDYREVKVAFKVKDPGSTEYEIVNFAQISEDADENGEEIKDIDSEPDNGEKEPKEDDEDIEKVKVEYFDLSLLKYVTKVLINENGEQRVIETGNTGDENDIIPHVQINKKNINKTVVKFAYTIKVTNEGQIEGEAREITDYVPEGLEFVEEDNTNWTDEGNNVISTRQLEGRVLQPGESAEVEVILRWKNGENNLGEKTNIAEISEDYNEEDIPDRDSTPDNKKEGEDDIDEATVLLSVNQGGGIQSIYMKLGLTFLVIILIGGIIIKKFVL